MATRFAKSILIMFAVALCTLTLSPTTAMAQLGLTRVGVVGGVSVDTNGVVTGKMDTLADKQRQRLVDSLKAADTDIDASVSLRMVSLKGLEAAIQSAVESRQPIPVEVQYMAGLQRIEYVVLNEKENDIVLAGPGEGWTVNQRGQVVGKSTGMPVLQLEDFLTAMRSVDSARSGQGISVSIDPTPEGVQQLNALYKRMKAQRQPFDPSFVGHIEEAFGAQTVTTTGVAADSHFSQVLLTADYQMKRLAMGLDESPLEELPSVMEMARRKKARMKSAAPRMWMECNYEPVAKSEDGSIWQIRGQGVRTLTEDSLFNEDGTVTQKGTKNAFAESWATTMTEKYEELSAKKPVFRELRNVMDVAVIAAILRNENLAAKVGLNMPLISGEGDPVKLPSRPVAKTVPAQVSYSDIGKGYNVSVSGGIAVDSWTVAQNTVVDAKIGDIAATAINRTADRWWWNGE